VLEFSGNLLFLSPQATAPNLAIFLQVNLLHRNPGLLDVVSAEILPFCSSNRTIVSHLCFSDDAAVTAGLIPKKIRSEVVFTAFVNLVERCRIGSETA
jgi:hypothetical protein